jgi:hypothetical protein
MSAKWHPHPQQPNIVSFLINIVSICTISLPFVHPKCNDHPLLHTPLLLSLHSQSNHPKIIKLENLTFFDQSTTVRREHVGKMASPPSINQYYFFFDQYSVHLCTLFALCSPKMQRLHTFALTNPLVFASAIQPSQNQEIPKWVIFLVKASPYGGNMSAKQHPHPQQTNIVSFLINATT